MGTANIIMFSKRGTCGLQVPIFCGEHSALLNGELHFNFVFGIVRNILFVEDFPNVSLDFVGSQEFLGILNISELRLPGTTSGTKES